MAKRELPPKMREIADKLKRGVPLYETGPKATANSSSTSTKKKGGEKS